MSRFVPAGMRARVLLLILLVLLPVFVLEVAGHGPALFGRELHNGFIALVGRKIENLLRL